MLKSYHQPMIREAGCDEAGRGCYAGPVFAAAVVLPQDFYHPLLNDSKLVPPDTRLELRTYIEAHAIDYAVGQVTNVEIDRINILWASFKAMHVAVKKLKTPPEFLLIDGHMFKKYKLVPHLCVIKGDGIYASIAAASILAKTYRDEYMQALHKKFPHYNWHSNKGYGTREHREGIAAHGICKYHRRSFNLFSTRAVTGKEADSGAPVATNFPVTVLPSPVTEQMDIQNGGNDSFFMAGSISNP